MNQDLERRALEIAAEALELEPQSRPAFLKEACSDSQELRAEVDSILAHEQIGCLLLPSSHSSGGDPNLPDPLNPGERIGAYRVEGLIDRGGMGAVYSAHRDDGAFNMRVAIKVMRWSGSQTDELLTRFLQERQVLAELEHPGIARLIDGGSTDSDFPYLVMELVEGESIDRFCETQDLTLEERIDLAEKVCRAVDFAHRRGVIHRDLKPTNILVTAEGQPKLLDFGIAKLLQYEESKTGDALPQTTGGWHTPEYASPEQIRREEIGPASDVYSLGIIVYELITGVRPSGAVNALSEDLRFSEEIGHPIPPSRLLDHLASLSGTTDPEAAHKYKQGAIFLAGALDDVVLAALRERPESRFPTAGEFAEALAAARGGHPISPPRTGRAPAIQRIVGSKLLIVGLAAVLAVGATALWLGSSRQKPPETGITTGILIARARIAIEDEQWAKAIAYSSAAVRRDPGSDIARLLMTTTLSRTPIEIELRAAVEGDTLHRTTETAIDSPTGGLTATIDNNNLRIIESSGQRTEAAEIHHDGRINSVVFHESGATVLTASDDKTARIWDVRSGLPLSEPMVHDLPVVHAAFTENNRWVQTVTADHMTRVWEPRARFPLVVRLVRRAYFWPGLWAYFPTGASSSGGDLLTAAELAGFVGTFGLQDLQRNPPPPSHELAITDAALSPDRALVATSSEDGTAQLWNTRSGERVGHTMVHDETGTEVAVTSVSFDRVGKRLATAASDGTLRVWNAESGKPLSDYLPHPRSIHNISFPSSGSSLLVLCSNGTVWAWELGPTHPPPTEVLEAAEAIGGLRIDDSGELEIVKTRQKAIALLREFAARPPSTDDPWQRWAANLLGY